MVNVNTNIQEILDMVDDDSKVTDFRVEGHKKLITIEKNNGPRFCPNCGSRLHSKGKITRSPNNPVLNDGYDLVVTLIGRRWKCPNENCEYTCTDSFNFIEPSKRNTNVPFMILYEMKDIHLTCKQVAKRYNVSDTYVFYTFCQYIDLPRKKLTSIISIDEVYLNLGNEYKYAIVIMDFMTGDILDILPSRRKKYTEAYFMSIPKEERDGVKYLISDMYNQYINFTSSYFKNAVSIVDSFHVIQWLLRLINIYINDVKKKYQKRDRKALEERNYRNNHDFETQKDSREVYILKKAKWVLLKNKENIEYYPKHWNSFLRQYLDTYDYEKEFLSLDPKFAKIRDLKDLYEDFNASYINEPIEASKRINELITIYNESDISMFKSFANLLVKYYASIVASFTYVTADERSKYHDQLRRLSNGPMESFNNIPSGYKRQSHGVSNFDFTRNRILWSTRDDAGILGNPKTKADIVKENKTDVKRGPYNKNKK